MINAPAAPLHDRCECTSCRCSESLRRRRCNVKNRGSMPRLLPWLLLRPLQRLYAAVAHGVAPVVTTSTSCFDLYDAMQMAHEATCFYAHIQNLRFRAKISALRETTVSAAGNQLHRRSIQHYDQSILGMELISTQSLQHLSKV